MSDKKISGFYYDIQKENPILKVTLHANTKPPLNPYETWFSWCDESIGSQVGLRYKVNDEGKTTSTIEEYSKDDNWTNGGKNTNHQSEIDRSFPDFLADSFDAEEDEPNELKTGGRDVRYGRMPICTSIVNEDFNISISNNWTNFEGGQQLESLFNDVLKPMSPFAEFVGRGVDKMMATLNEKFSGKEDGFGGVYNKYIKNNLAAFSNTMKVAGNGLSRNLVVQGTRFKYWSGTNIDFGNLSMKFTLFADYVNIKKPDGSNTTVWKTPDDQLSSLIPYCVGKYLDFFNEKELDPLVMSASNNISDSSLALNDQGDENKLIVNNYLGWQTVPGGFRAQAKYLDKIQFGTLMLKIGPYYKLKNLVIQNLQLNYSKQVAKYLDTTDNKIKTCPLFCEVTLTLAPVTKYSEKLLREFVLARSKTTYSIVRGEAAGVEKKTGEDGKDTYTTKKQVPVIDEKTGKQKVENGKPVYREEDIKTNTYVDTMGETRVIIGKVTPDTIKSKSIINLEDSINKSLGL